MDSSLYSVILFVRTACLHVICCTSFFYSLISKLSLLFPCRCRYCFVVTLGYLILCQITRVYVFDYGMYSADFTGWAGPSLFFLFHSLKKPRDPRWSWHWLLNGEQMVLKKKEWNGGSAGCDSTNQSQTQKANKRLSGLSVWRMSTGTVTPRRRLTLAETVWQLQQTFCTPSWVG